MAEQTPERLGQGAFAAGPGASLTGHDEGAEDRAISHFDGLDQNSPGDPRDHTRERADRGIPTKLVLDPFLNMRQGVLRPGRRKRLEVDADNGVDRFGHDGDDLGTRYHLYQRLDDETGL